MRRSFIASALALGATAAGFAGPAGADPNSDVIALVCDNGQSYEVAVAGGGDFTPAHDLASTGMLVPVAFGEFTGTITGPDGVVIETFTEPAYAKGQSGKNKSLVTCTFSFEFVNEGPDADPELPVGAIFEGSGSVSGFLTPARTR